MTIISTGVTLLRKFIAVRILALLILVMLSPKIVPASDEYHSIEPGWRVGPIVITMTRADIERVFGRGAYYVIPDVDKSLKLTLLQYKNLGLDFIFKNDQLEEIHINHPNYKLKEVVKVGCNVAAVEEVLGKGYIRENYQHSYEPHLPDYKMIYAGIIFYVKKDRVVKISVVRQK